MKTKPYQFRIDPNEPREAELLKKLERAAKATGMSKNTLVNLAAAAGLPMVEKKLKEIHEPEAQAA
jgi:hypothetical protein